MMLQVTLSTLLSDLRFCFKFNRFFHSSCSLMKEASLKKEELNPAIDEVSEEEAAAEQERLAKLCDKSRLKPHHYKIVHKIANSMDELEQDVTSVRDVRARYGRDGDGSNVQLRYLWPSQQEMNLMKEYEKVFNPLSLPDTIAKAKHDKQEAIKFTVERQKALRENMKSLEKWKKAVRDKIRDNEEAARIAREKQARLIEEVRLMYGARIDPHDEKFQEILAQKEEEEKKTQKALKKQQKQQKLVEQMKKIAEQAKQKADEENQKNTPLPPTDQTSTNVV